MDKDNYPTEETLSKIESWDCEDFKGLAQFLYDLWVYDDYISFDGIVLNLSTGGWSGHEDLIRSIPRPWWYNYFYSQRSGGHYIFTSD